jgi:hypothetical protein
MKRSDGGVRSSEECESAGLLACMHREGVLVADMTGESTVLRPGWEAQERRVALQAG